jgi:hypothetical protein
MHEHPSEAEAEAALAVCETHGVYPVECRWDRRTWWVLTLTNPEDEAEDFLVTVPHPELGLQVLLFEGAAGVGRYVASLTAADPHAAALRSWWAEFQPWAEIAVLELLHLDYLPLHLDQLADVHELSAEDDQELMTFLYRYGELVYHLPDDAIHDSFLADPNIAEYIEAYFNDMEALYTSSTFQLDAFRDALQEAVSFVRDRVLPANA